MTSKDRIRHHIIRQFSHPQGIYGRIAGRIMSSRGTNIARNEWVAEILDPPIGAHILEIGHGPGLAIENLSVKLRGGHVTGLELSELMSRAAARRNRAAVQNGSVDFRVGDSANPPDDLRDLDVIYGINATMFWADPRAAIAELTTRLKPGGQLLVAYMPPPTATEPADVVAKALHEWFETAGLTQITTRTGPPSRRPSPSLEPGSTKDHR